MRFRIFVNAATLFLYALSTDNIAFMHKRSIHDILPELIAAEGITPTELARRAGLVQSSVQRILSRSTKSPKDEVVKPLADYFKLTPDQIRGHQPMPEARSTGANEEPISGEKPESNAELIGMMSAWDNTTPLGEDEVAIPLYKEVEMAAGCGATEVIEVPGRLLRFAKSTLREAGVQERNAACATITGRSMERLIMHGATVGIDMGTTHIDDGEIYAFDQDGMLRVKYLYRLPGGGVRIRSENDDEFPDETLTPEEFASVRMLGWVFWWSTVRRRRGLSLAR